MTTALHQAGRSSRTRRGNRPHRPYHPRRSTTTPYVVGEKAAIGRARVVALEGGAGLGRVGVRVAAVRVLVKEAAILLVGDARVLVGVVRARRVDALFALPVDGAAGRAGRHAVRVAVLARVLAGAAVVRPLARFLHGEARG